MSERPGGDERHTGGEVLTVGFTEKHLQFLRGVEGYDKVRSGAFLGIGVLLCAIGGIVFVANLVAGAPAQVLVTSGALVLIGLSAFWMRRWTTRALQRARGTQPDHAFRVGPQVVDLPAAGRRPAEQWPRAETTVARTAGSAPTCSRSAAPAARPGASWSAPWPCPWSRSRRP